MQCPTCGEDHPDPGPCPTCGPAVAETPTGDGSETSAGRSGGDALEEGSSAGNLPGSHGEGATSTASPHAGEIDPESNRSSSAKDEVRGGSDASPSSGQAEGADRERNDRASIEIRGKVGAVDVSQGANSIYAGVLKLTTVVKQYRRPKGDPDEKEKSGEKAKSEKAKSDEKAESGQKAGEEPPRKLRSLMERTTELPRREATGVVVATDEAAPWMERLRSERLLLVSCQDGAVGLAAVHALVDGIGVRGGAARLLNFDNEPVEGATQTVYDLIRAPNEREGEILVVVDAVSHRAQPFLDRLLDPLNGAWAVPMLRGDLEEARLLVVCQIPPEREGPFSRWDVPFLDLLLAAAFPSEHRELRVEILRQRARGRWSRNDAVFCRQVRAALGNDSLQEVVAAGGLSLNDRVELDVEQPVHNSVLYTAGFFPRLNPADFGRVVTVLLGDQTMLLPPEPVPVADDDEAGSPPAPAAPRTKRLAEVWRESGDRILRECRLGVIRDGEGSRAVGFADPSAGDSLREHFEDDHPFTHHVRFAALHEARLLFDRSEAVAAGVVRLTTDMASAYPETYGREWLLERLGESPAAEPHEAVFTRFAQLLRGLCEQVALQPVVAGVMERLLATRDFRIAMALVRRLRFAPGFDAFYWMRQLVDRGTSEARKAVADYLYGEAVRAGSQVYPLLHALQPWLPPEDERPERYSPSGWMALRLLVHYAADMVGRLKDEDYGAWPSRYALLAVSSPEAAARDLSLLLGWLLHPGVSAVVTEEKVVADEGEPVDAGALVAALFAAWVFILFGSARTPAGPPLAEEPADAPFGADDLLAVLLREFAERTSGVEGRRLRMRMLDVWERRKAEFTECLCVRGPAFGPVRTECAWKRRLVRTLLLRVRALRAAPPAAASSVTV